MNCSDTGEKECLGHFTGQNCSLCEPGWYGSGCDLYCDLNSTLWTCGDHGTKICIGSRKGMLCCSGYIRIVGILDCSDKFLYG